MVEIGFDWQLSGVRVTAHITHTHSIKVFIFHYFEPHFIYTMIWNLAGFLTTLLSCVKLTIHFYWHFRHRDCQFNYILVLFNSCEDTIKVICLDEGRVIYYFIQYTKKMYYCIWKCSCEQSFDRTHVDACHDWTLWPLGGDIALTFPSCLWCWQWFVFMSSFSCPQMDFFFISSSSSSSFPYYAAYLDNYSFIHLLFQSNVSK